MNKIKVIHVLHAVGGVDIYLRLLLETIDHNLFEHIVVKGLKDNTKPYRKPNGELIKTYELPINREINLINDLKSIKEVVNILKKEKPNIVHAHSAKGGIIARTASLFFKINVLHTPHAYSYLSANSNFKRKIFLLIERFYKNINSVLLATSNSEYIRGVEDVGYKKEKVIVFNNSIKPIDKIEELSIPKTWPNSYICSVGRPSYQKNIELMLDVLFEIKRKKDDIHLVLMGVGFHSPNLKNIERKIKIFNLEKNVTLLDWTSREDVFNIISKSLLYISTSRYEGLPYSLIETLALSKPIVATDCDGNRDLVINNYNGYLVENNDKYDMSKHILSIINDYDLNIRLSSNSFKLFSNHFNLLNNIKTLNGIYSQNCISYKKI